MTMRIPEPSLLSDEMAALMARIAAEGMPQPDPTLLPPAEGRAQCDEANARWNVDLPDMAEVLTVWLDADEALGSARCRLRVFVPESAGTGLILFIHGGGFAFCSPETHERCARVLAVEAGMAVVVPDYRLAPEHPYPAGLNDTIAALRHVGTIAERCGLAGGPVMVAGDSAGANLALAAILHEQSQGAPAPAGALLFYGTYDRDFETASYRQFAEGPGLTRAKMQRYWTMYAGDRPVAVDPLACPLQASDAALSRLPPLHLMAAGVDPLLSDTLSLQARLKSVGRTEAVTVVSGVTHGFLQNTIDLRAAREALRFAGVEARRMAALS